MASRKAAFTLAAAAGVGIGLSLAGSLSFAGCSKEDETTSTETEVETSTSGTACTKHTTQSSCDKNSTCAWVGVCEPQTLSTLDAIYHTQFCDFVGAIQTTLTGGYVCYNEDESLSLTASSNNCAEDGKPIEVDNPDNCHTDCYATEAKTCTYAAFTCSYHEEDTETGQEAGCYPDSGDLVSRVVSNWNLHEYVCQDVSNKCQEGTDDNSGDGETVHFY